MARPVPVYIPLYHYQPVGQWCVIVLIRSAVDGRLQAHYSKQIVCLLIINMSEYKVVEHSTTECAVYRWNSVRCARHPSAILGVLDCGDLRKILICVLAMAFQSLSATN